jgi:hypothetical protein
MEATPGESLVVLELVSKYGDAFVIGMVEEAATYLLSQGNGFMIAA